MQIKKSNDNYNLNTAHKSVLAVIALIKVKAGTEELFKKAALNIVPLTLKETGNYCYIFHQSNSNSSEFSFYEQWESEEHLNAHLNSLHMKKFFNEISPLLEGESPQIMEYRNLM